MFYTIIQSHSDKPWTLVGQTYSMEGAIDVARQSAARHGISCEVRIGTRGAMRVYADGGCVRLTA